MNACKGFWDYAGAGFMAFCVFLGVAVLIMVVDFAITFFWYVRQKKQTPAPRVRAKNTLSKK